mmetsp:Transcript_40594/g.96787  ORF Transcript_40594/g.96787 Transcript_40594/m.96787 type:complete len:415 (-) Transcript_40594:86-1330(-)
MHVLLHVVLKLTMFAVHAMMAVVPVVAMVAMVEALPQASLGALVVALPVLALGVAELRLLEAVALHLNLLKGMRTPAVARMVRAALHVALARGLQLLAHVRAAWQGAAPVAHVVMPTALVARNNRLNLGTALLKHRPGLGAALEAGFVAAFLHAFLALHPGMHMLLHLVCHPEFLLQILTLHLHRCHPELRFQILSPVLLLRIHLVSDPEQLLVLLLLLLLCMLGPLAFLLRLLGHPEPHLLPHDFHQCHVRKDLGTLLMAVLRLAMPVTSRRLLESAAHLQESFTLFLAAGAAQLVITAPHVALDDVSHVRICLKPGGALLLALHHFQTLACALRQAGRNRCVLLASLQHVHPGLWALLDALLVVLAPLLAEVAIAHLLVPASRKVHSHHVLQVWLSHVEGGLQAHQPQAQGR